MVSTSREQARCAQLTLLNPELVSGETVPVDCDSVSPWFEPGVNSEISEETFFYFLELLPPRWMNGSMFTFGEGSGLFRLFWQRDG